MPREVHGDLPYLPWLPFGLSSRFCRWQSQRHGVPEPVQRQYDTATRLRHFVSIFALRRLANEAGVPLAWLHHPESFYVNPSTLGAWGTRHPVLALPFRVINNWFLHDVLAEYLRRRPHSRVKFVLAHLFNQELIVVLRKPVGGTLSTKAGRAAARGGYAGDL